MAFPPELMPAWLAVLVVAVNGTAPSCAELPQQIMKGGGEYLGEE
jgi:hypothetical protein